METIAYYRRLFAYDAWANQEALVALERADPLPPRALERMAHVLAAQVVWLERLGRRVHPEPLAIWPALTLAECEALLVELERAWTGYLADVDEDTLAASVSYVTSKGDPWTNRVADVLTHVSMHGAYHRGQIASDLRAAGNTPAATDFILAVRQDFVE